MERAVEYEQIMRGEMVTLDAGDVIVTNSFRGITR